MTGRPTIRTVETDEAIIDGLIEGMSLRKMCLANDMPNRSTVLRWLDDDEAFAAKYARAREMQGDYMDDLIQDTADETTNENAQASRVKIAAYQWRAEKLKPKRYAPHLKLSGDPDAPLNLSLAVQFVRSDKPS